MPVRQQIVLALFSVVVATVAVDLIEMGRFVGAGALVWVVDFSARRAWQD